jgi:hypothetical protein
MPQALLVQLEEMRAHKAQAVREVHRQPVLLEEREEELCSLHPRVALRMLADLLVFIESQSHQQEVEL